MFLATAKEVYLSVAENNIYGFSRNQRASYVRPLRASKTCTREEFIKSDNPVGKIGTRTLGIPYYPSSVDKVRRTKKEERLHINTTFQANFT